MTNSTGPKKTPIINRTDLQLWRSIRDWFVRDWLAILIFTLCALIAMYPILPSLQERIIGWGGDNVQYVYMTGWFAKALANLKTPFSDPHLNFPDQLVLAATDMPYAGFILISPLAWLFNPIIAYNSWILISYLLSGYFTYLWIRRLTNNRFAGIVSGLVFLLIPYRVVHSYGHLQLVSTQFIPLFFWSLDQALQSSNRKNLFLLTGATFLLSSGSAQYFLMICLLSGVMYVLLWKPDFQFIRNQSWKFILAIGLGAIIGSLPYLTAAGNTLYESYSIEETRLWAASLTDYLIPSRLHPLWEEFIERVYPRKTWIEHTLYAGSIASILALIGCILPDEKNKKRIRVWLGVAFTAWIFSLGTDLHLYLGKPLQVNDPIWLPAYYLGQLPFIDNMRVWARFAIIPLFFISLLAGLGISALSKRRTLGLPVMIFIIALIIFDMMPGRIESTLLNYRSVDQWIAQQKGDDPFAFLPAGAQNYAAMYGSLLHEKRLPAYNHPTHLPQAFLEFATIADTLPREGSLDALKAQGYRFLIFDQSFYNGEYYPDWEDIENSIMRSPDIKIIAEVDGFVITEFTSGQ